MGNILTLAIWPMYTTLSWFSWKLYRHRSLVNRLKKDGIPMPAWSWLSGNICHLFRHSRELPSAASINLAFFEMASEFRGDEMFLVDIWPLSEPMLVVFNPEAAFQICQRLNLPKGKKDEEMIRPITGGISLLSMNGDAWKTWRTLFSPGFSSGAIMDQIPEIVDHVSSFCVRLEKCTEGGIFCLDQLTTQLTFEIIVKITLNADLGVDYDHHIFVRAMRNIIRWHSFWDPRILMNPMRPLVNWYNGRIVNKWIQAELQLRYETLSRNRQYFIDSRKKPSRSVLDLAIEGYMDSKEGKFPERLDPSFMRTATHQMRLFLFAGNDTTSSTIVFVFHLLSKNQHALGQLRAEHDEVFGAVLQTADRIKEDPSLLTKCKLTLAVIKETLRLYAPAASMRTGNQDCLLTTQRGVSFSTAGFALLIQHHSIHRNERLWPRAEEFLPERWLVEPGHILYPLPGAWRPFEHGPRNCIGQTLSLTEIKIVLAMTVRSFDIKSAYEDLDKMKAKNAGCSAWLFGEQKSGLYRGDRAYQTEKAGAHPAEGYPCYVSPR